jgi:hypothetical protein
MFTFWENMLFREEWPRSFALESVLHDFGPQRASLPI